MARDSDIFPLIAVAAAVGVFVWFKQKADGPTPGYDNIAEYRAFLSKVYPDDASKFALMNPTEITALYIYHTEYVAKGKEPAPGSGLDTALNAIVSKYGLG